MNDMFVDLQSGRATLGENVVHHITVLIYMCHIDMLYVQTAWMTSPPPRVGELMRGCQDSIVIGSMSLSKYHFWS
jgi:hypothetical protein